jgi:hypothetical protein
MQVSCEKKAPHYWFLILGVCVAAVLRVVYVVICDWFLEGHFSKTK